MIRSMFAAALRHGEPVAAAAAQKLASNDVKEAAQSLNARLVRRPEAADGQGCLRRDGTGWVVEVKDDLDELSGQGRHVVAHELAHLLLLERGMPVPCTSEEYWTLEDACDRIAMRLQQADKIAGSSNGQ